jgi:hypothetical protein
MFALLLFAVVLSSSVVGVFIVLPLLAFFNVYMIAGIAFTKVAYFQGFVWWERAIIIFIDFIVILIVSAFIAGIAWYVCDQSGLGGGAAATAVVKVVDWWNGNEYASGYTWESRSGCSWLEGAWYRKYTKRSCLRPVLQNRNDQAASHLDKRYSHHR